MMFWEDIEPIMTDRLQAAIEQAYGVFSRYRIKETIVYCDCPVCMTEEQARKLSTLPLQEIGAGLLGEYTNSAHGYDFDTIEQDFKHFLPRYLDLIGNCDIPCQIGAETCLCRLGDANYRARWPEHEAAAIGEFFTAFVEASVDQLLLIEWPVGLRLEFDMGEVLAMIAIAGGDVDAVLAVLGENNDPGAATHLASLRGDIELRAGTFVYTNAHLLDKHWDDAAKIAEFAMRNSVTERILTAADTLNDPNYDGVLEIGLSAAPSVH